METPAPVLLLTRPRAQSEEFAADIHREFGDAFTTLIAPVLRIVAEDVSIELDSYRFLVASSANAISACGSALQGALLPIFCVGARTAEAARSLGLNVAGVAPTGEELSRLVSERGVHGPALFLRGRHVAVDLADRLKSLGIETDSRVVYRQEALELTPEARSALAGDAPVVLPVFSPRSARLLSEQIGAPRAPLRVVAISRNAAEAWGSGQHPVSIAETPDRPGMLAAIAAFLRR